jgi:hypothetical protein
MFSWLWGGAQQRELYTRSLDGVSSLAGKWRTTCAAFDSAAVQQRQGSGRVSAHGIYPETRLWESICEFFWGHKGVVRRTKSDKRYRKLGHWHAGRPCGIGSIKQSAERKTFPARGDNPAATGLAQVGCSCTGRKSYIPSATRRATVISSARRRKDFR